MVGAPHHQEARTETQNILILEHIPLCCGQNKREIIILPGEGKSDP